MTQILIYSLFRLSARSPAQKFKIFFFLIMFLTPLRTIVSWSASSFIIVRAKKDTIAHATETLKKTDFGSVKKFIEFIKSLPRAMQYHAQVEADKILSRRILNESDRAAEYWDYVLKSGTGKKLNLKQEKIERDHQDRFEIMKATDPLRNKRIEARTRIGKEWEANALATILRINASFQELQSIRAAAIKLTWENVKERLIEAIIDRIMSLRYATPHLLISITQDWKFINDKKFVLKSAKETDLKMLRVHVNGNEVLKMRESFLSSNRRLRKRILDTMSSDLSDPPASSNAGEDTEEEELNNEKKSGTELSDQNFSEPDEPGPGRDKPTKIIKKKLKGNAPGEPPAKKPRKKEKDPTSKNPPLSRPKPVAPLCNCDKRISVDWKKRVRFKKNGWETCEDLLTEKRNLKLCDKHEKMLAARLDLRTNDSLFLIARITFFITIKNKTPHI